MSRTGVDRSTGEILTGWPHVSQSIQTIVSTEIGSRFERRDFGANLEGLIDKPQTEEIIVDFAIAVAEALEPRPFGNRFLGEPNFQPNMTILDLGTPAIVTLNIGGIYFPYGHKGDFTVFEDQFGLVRL